MGDAPPTKARAKTKKPNWRPWVRGVHRDAGYFVVGFTFIYAISGLAVNHRGDWEPESVVTEKTVPLDTTLSEDENEATREVMAELKLDGEPADVFGTDLDLEFRLDRDNTTVFVDKEAKTILVRSERDRVLIKAANWLHLAKGKKAWKYVADVYAILLLYLATSGMVMLPGKKGFAGRGWILVVAGIAVPVIYVLWSGGPWASA